MFFKVFPKRYTARTSRVYLDYASSTPVDTAMFLTMKKIPAWCSGANPNALHKEGVTLGGFLADARTQVARTLGGHADEVIFTGSATESDNLALIGTIKGFLAEGVGPEKIAVWVSPFEHSAVTEAVAQLDVRITVCFLEQAQGVVIPTSFIPDATHSHILLSVMYIQNEVGTVQPIKALAKQVRRLRKHSPEKIILFHSDATQAPLFYDLHVLRLGIDMMTLGATKLYCEKGVGLLWKRRGVVLAPLFYGGGQEFGLRPGTQAVSLIHQFAHALVCAQTQREKEAQTVATLRIFMESQLQSRFPILSITAAAESRAPHITHVSLPGFESELFVLELDARGIAVSSKSACKNDEPSYTSTIENTQVLKLLYGAQPRGTLRISYGRMTTKKELRKALDAIESVLKKYSLL